MGKRRRRADDENEGSAPDLDPEWVARMRRSVVAWFQVEGRRLPWRADADPYRVLVSEMMLVQTTVAAVVPYYERFLARFPTVEALALADEDEVLKLWEGLGYYRRARQLHQAARRVVERHGGRIPDDPDDLRALPGVGRYIAGAVLSMAFDRPAAILEANTQRVLARWLAWPGMLGESATQARLWLAAERLVPPVNPGSFNQGLMDLGASICAPRSPGCLICPVEGDCRSRLLGRQDAIPVVAARAAPLAVAETSALVHRVGRYLVLQRGPGGLWDGFWEFPTVHREGADPAGRREAQGGDVGLGEGVARISGVSIEVGASLGSLTYAVTRHRIAAEARECQGLTSEVTLAKGFRDGRWARVEELAALPFGRAGRHWIAVLRKRTGLAGG